MWWSRSLPYLTGHKMSGNYIRVIPSVSTLVTKIFRNPRSGTSSSDRDCSVAVAVAVAVAVTMTGLRIDVPGWLPE